MGGLKVSYKDEALADLRRLHRFLKPKSARSADRAVVAIRDAIQRLSRFPEAGRKAPDGDPLHREMTVKFGGSGYLILYGLDGSDVLIIAIRHQREAGY